MTHRPGPRWILVHPDRDRHLMESVRVWWDLQRGALIAHRSILGHDARVVHAYHICAVRPDPRDEGRARFGRPYHKPVVLGREDARGQIPVGRRPLRDPGERQLFGQSILERPEHAFRPAPCVGRVGRNQRDASWLYGAVHLGQPDFVHASSRLLGMPVV